MLMGGGEEEEREIGRCIAQTENIIGNIVYLDSVQKEG